MNRNHRTLAIASALLALPLFAYSQNASTPDSQYTQASQEASLMKPAQATLVNSLDAKKDQTGATIDAKLNQKVKLVNGTELPKGTILEGQIVKDDMQVEGTSKLALRFDQAKLKDGKTVPVRATIVGFYGPGSVDMEIGDDEDGALPNDWTAKTLQFDQLGVTKDVDLHSKIASENSGVFVSTKRDDVKLRAGSEIQFAIGSGSNQTAKAGQ
jgi:hypothetical protein